MSIFTLRPHLFHEIVEPVPGVGQEVRLLMREREDTRANLRANKSAADPGPSHRRRSNTTLSVGRKAPPEQLVSRGLDQ